VRLWDDVSLAGGSQASVQLCAVTKTHSRELVDLACEVGLNIFGENYAVELLDKAHNDDLFQWHYLGAIQRKKVAKLAPVVDLFQGLCRVEEAEAIAKVQPGAKVLVQIDTTGFAQRSGLSLGAFPGFFEQLQAVDVAVEGVMTIAPPGRDEAKACFASVRKLADDFQFSVCSMGMSSDLQDAVSAGSTMVRVGHALFGPRG
jgi:uncharacterized pyridoxal phosphate-containing UPF0001 family protein